MVRSSVVFGVCAILVAGLTPLQAQAEKRVLKPESAWLVGPVASVQGQENPSCVLSNEYDNGFYMKFTGGADGFQSLKVDFRQPSFKTGQEYDISFVIPPEFTTNIKGKAYNTAGLEFDLSGTEGFAEKIKESESVFLKVGTTVVPFSLAGIDDGLSRLDACAGDMPQNIQPAAGTEEKPMDIGRAKVVEDEIIISLPRPKTMAPADEAPQNLTAQEHEQTEMQAISEKRKPLEIPVMAAAEPITKVVIEKTKGEQAAPTQDAEIIAEAHEEELTPLPVKEIEPITITSVREDISEEQVVWNTPPRDNTRVWQALQGLSLHETLRGWSRREGVDLVWDSEKDFSVRNTLSIDANYEKAVEHVLNQYTEEGTRPFGALHVDPASGMRVLIIRDQSRI